MQKIFRSVAVILIILSMIVLLVALYSGGLTEIAGFQIESVELPTLTIILSVLFAIYRLVRKPLPLKEAISENSFPLLICFVLIVYVANYRTTFASDTVPARYLPFSLLREGNFDLDEFRNLHPRASISGITYKRNHYLSSYPVGAPIFAIPFYLPSAIGHVRATTWFAASVEKLAASSIVVVSIIFMYFTLLRLTSRRTALVIAAIYALGTSSLSISSQALWQHGPSQLCLSASLYCLVRGSKEPIWNSFAGFPAALAVVCRPTDALLVAPIGIYVLFHQTRRFPMFLLCSVPPIIFQLLYNYIYFANPFRTQWEVTRGSFWSTPLIDGAANILFSPGRGLLVYSPIFLLSFLGMIYAWRKEGTLLFRYCCIGVVLNLLLYSKFFMWWGGFTYGPRLLADLSPILCLFLCEIKTLFTRRSLRIAFLILSILSISAHAIGAYADDPLWNMDMDVDSSPQSAWVWGDNQLINAPKRGWNKVKIGVFRLPTTQSNPELFAADFRAELPEFILVRPQKRIQITVHSQNTGKAVWLHGSAKQSGIVYLSLSWHRKGKTLDRFSHRRRLRYQVFPGDSYRFFAEIETPDREGRYNLEIALIATHPNSNVIGKFTRIPVRIEN